MHKCKISSFKMYGIKYMLKYKMHVFFCVRFKWVTSVQVAIVYCITDYVCVLEISNFNYFYYSYHYYGLSRPKYLFL